MHGVLNKKLVGKHAYTAIVDPELGYILGRADYGIGGYTPMRHRAFKTWDAAKKFAEEINGREGLTVRESLEIVLNTMR